MFPHTIDLHDLTIQQGYNKSLMLVKLAFLNGKKTVRIITGRSGKMNKEFKKWIENPVFKPYVDIAYQDYHKGSWAVMLKKNT